MKVLVSGARGLVGSALTPRLEASGIGVHRLVRGESTGRLDEVRWDPLRGILEPGSLSGFGAIIHLSGEPLARWPWSAARKKSMRDSRVLGTRLLSSAIAQCSERPPVLVCASAVGWYGDRGDEVLTEASPRGAGFLSDLCAEWEAAADPAREAGVRVSHLRFGMVLGGKGGLLKPMLPIFNLGLGGPLGSGRQWWSWIELGDLAAAIELAIHDPALRGAVNATAPGAVRCSEFVQTLGRVLHRPAVLPAPAFALRMVLGEMADELALASARVRPEVLEKSGFSFRFAELEPALREATRGREGIR